MMNKLLIFIKNPIKGKAKTRLAATVGDEEALRIYLELLKHTRNISLEVDGNRYLYYSHFIDNQDEWSNTAFKKSLQKGDDLGNRMANGFLETFEKQDQKQKVIIIGSDCASLTADFINRAFEQLDHYHFVIGPAMDGGYYLLGMNHLDTSVFQEINWSSETTLTETLAVITKNNKTYYLLPKLSDIDHEEDWIKYGW